MIQKGKNRMSIPAQAFHQSFAIGIVPWHLNKDSPGGGQGVTAKTDISAPAGPSF